MSLKRKIVAGIVGVSVATYGCSAAFIFYLKDFIAPGTAQWLYTSIILLLGVAWTGVLGWLGAAWLIKPLSRLTEAANIAAAGNLRTEIPLHGSDDEIRALGLSVRRLIEELRQALQDVASNAAFTHAHAGELSGGMDQAAEQIAMIASATDTIAKGAAEQKEFAEGTLRAVRSIQDAAADIDAKAGESKAVSEEMLRTLQRSESIVRSLVEGMSDLAASNREAIGIVEELQLQAKQIRAISGVVGDIAQQTHLLALNASIEAARADGRHARTRRFIGPIDELGRSASRQTFGIPAIEPLFRQTSEYD